MGRLLQGLRQIYRCLAGVFQAQVGLLEHVSGLSSLVAPKRLVLTARAAGSSEPGLELQREER